MINFSLSFFFFFFFGVCVEEKDDPAPLIVYWLDDLAPCIARKGCSKWLNSVRFHITYIVLVCDMIV